MMGQEVIMGKKYKPTENKELAEAFRELRKGSRTSPHETKDKRLRTKERIIADELRKGQTDGQDAANQAALGEAP